MLNEVVVSLMASVTSLSRQYDIASSDYLDIKLIHEEQEYKQYAVVGHQIIREALVPAEINIGEMFQVCNLDGSTSIAVWLGTLKKSLSILQPQ